MTEKKQTGLQAFVSGYEARDAEWLAEVEEMIDDANKILYVDPVENLTEKMSIIYSTQISVLEELKTRLNFSAENSSDSSFTETNLSS